MFTRSCQPPTVFDPSKPTLPVEIICMILHNLKPACRFERRTFAAACLASRQVLPLAREFLYRTLYLRITDQVKGGDGAPLNLRDSAHGMSSLAIDYKRLAVTLGAHPHLARLVHRVELDSSGAEFPDDAVGALEPLERILEACPVREVRVVRALGEESHEGPEARHVVRVLWQSKRQFTLLDLGVVDGAILPGADPREVGLWKLLAEQNSLDDLALELHDARAVDPPPSFPFTLCRLSLKLGGTRGPRLFARFLEHSSSTLTHLELSLNVGEGPPGFDFETLATLKNLTVHIQGNARFIDSTARREQVANEWKSLLSVGYSLGRLTVRLPGWLQGSPPPSYVLALPPTSIPFGLSALNIREVPYPPSAILAYLQSSRSYLKKISYNKRIHPGLRGAPEATDADVWDPARIEAVRLLLEEKGIREMAPERPPVCRLLAFF